MLKTYNITIYTDGAQRYKKKNQPYDKGCSGGIIFFNDLGKSFSFSSVLHDCNTIQAELMAVYYSQTLLSKLIYESNILPEYNKDDSLLNITYYIDNQVVVKGLTRWINNWMKNNFVSYEGGLVRHEKLWKGINSTWNNPNHYLPKPNYYWIESHKDLDILKKDKNITDEILNQYIMNSKVDAMIKEDIDNPESEEKPLLEEIKKLNNYWN